MLRSSLITAGALSAIATSSFAETATGSMTTTLNVGNPPSTCGVTINDSPDFGYITSSRGGLETAYGAFRVLCDYVSAKPSISLDLDQVLNDGGFIKGRFFTTPTSTVFNDNIILYNILNAGSLVGPAYENVENLSLMTWTSENPDVLGGYDGDGVIAVQLSDDPADHTILPAERAVGAYSSVITIRVTYTPSTV